MTERFEGHQFLTEEEQAEVERLKLPRPKVTKKEAIDASEEFRRQHEVGTSPLCETVARYWRGE